MAWSSIQGVLCSIWTVSYHLMSMVLRLYWLSHGLGHPIPSSDDSGKQMSTLLNELPRPVKSLIPLLTFLFQGYLFDIARMHLFWNG